ncbi:MULTISPECIES: linear amide C-N hydrolase [Lactobacillus]|nr:linear amide C-N hydrolase [Lactobacillus johnsonii]
MEDGLHVYDNPVGAMTNNPPFPIMKFALNDYYALSCQPTAWTTSLLTALN